MASYIDPGLQDKFESLSTELKNYILERNVKLFGLNDRPVFMPVKCLLH